MRGLVFFFFPRNDKKFLFLLIKNITIYEQGVKFGFYKSVLRHWGSKNSSSKWTCIAFLLSLSLSLLILPLPGWLSNEHVLNIELRSFMYSRWAGIRILLEAWQFISFKNWVHGVWIFMCRQPRSFILHSASCIATKLSGTTGSRNYTGSLDSAVQIVSSVCVNFFLIDIDLSKVYTIRAKARMRYMFVHLAQ